MITVSSEPRQPARARPPDDRARRGAALVRSRLRGVAVGLVATATVLGASALPAAGAAAGPVGAVALTDWSRSPGSSGGWGDGYGPVTVDSAPASAAQSTGVVLIDTVLDYSGAQGAGTGMVLTASGEVLTNYHVVEGATDISVTVATTARTYDATVVGSDQTRDIALLQLTGASGLDPVTVDNDTARLGDDVSAVGNAGGTGTLTAAAGTVTSLTATVTTAAEGTIDSQTLRNLIETDADVVAGDSGGPLYDAEGEVIGIDTAASTGAQIDGYAIPIDDALGVVQQIRSGTETSTVRIGPAAFLGVLLGGDSRAAVYGQADRAGVTIGGVVSGGPAAQAGLAAGDVITGLGAGAVTSADALSTRLAGYEPGATVTLTWTDTGGSSHTATVTLAANPAA